VRRVYRFVRRPRGRAAKVLITNGNKVLLVRPGYNHRQWTTPGGAVDKNETFEVAARREVEEELDIQLDALSEITTYDHVFDGQTNIVQIFHAEVTDPRFTVDGIEIVEAEWFPIERLPPDRRSRIDEIVKIFKASAKTGTPLAL